MLEHLLGKNVFSENISDRIKTFEDALEETGRPNVPEFIDAPEDLRQYLQAQYKAVVIAEALNEGWTPDYSDGGQKNGFRGFVSALRVSRSTIRIALTRIRLRVARPAFA